MRGLSGLYAAVIPAQTGTGKTLCSSLFVLLLLCSAAFAQKDTGAIAGLVKDPSGAAVAGAKVTVTDVDRGTTFASTSNEQGEFLASPLKIGRYNVAVEKNGFKKTVVGPVRVDVQARPEVDVTLQVGSITETMTVTTQGPQLETETSELGQVVGTHTITGLPLNGRNYAQLAQLTAGVAPTEPGSRAELSFGFSSNGARALQNNFLLDGIDNNANLGDLLNGSTYVIQPSVDAIAEFKVETNAYTAEFGRGNGAIMNAVIKSGTNQVHGDVYEFLRNDKLDGRNAFDQQRQPYKQNQFGFTLGGPIIKNRTFFFVDYEGNRIRTASPQTLLLPTPAQLGGNLADQLTTSPVNFTDATGLFGVVNTVYPVLDCSSNPTFQGEIFNSQVTQQVTPSGSNPTGLCGLPVGVTGSGAPTNIIPPGSISQAVKNLVALFPQPNAPNQANGNNYLVDPTSRINQNNFDVRVDDTISQKDAFFSRFSYEDQPKFIPGPFNNFLDGGGFTAGDIENSYRSIAISETHLFSANLVNEFRLGYNRINSHRVEPYANTDVSSQLGLKGVPFEPGIGGLPSMCFAFIGTCLGSSGCQPSRELQNSYVLTENLTWVHGRHSAKFGVEIRREEFTLFQPSAARGTLTFAQDFTNNPGLPNNPDGSPTGGSDVATWLLGIPDSANLVNLHNVDYFRQIYAGYVQDDIRATSRLTLNLGLRYELFRPITERNNQQATFDFRSDSLIMPAGQNAALTPTIATAIPVQRNASPGLIAADYLDFAPRLGIAYRITDRLALRSGFGIFYGGQENGPFSNPSPGFSPPFFSSQSFLSQNSCFATQLGFFPSNANPADPANCAIGFPNLLISNFWTGGFPSTSLSDPNSPSLFSLDPHLKTPYAQQWHVGFQYQLPGETVIDLSYAGSRGQRLFSFFNGNQFPHGFAINGPRPFTPPASSNVIVGSIPTFRSNAYSNYHSLQAHIEKRVSHGLQFEASYTYSHALDVASSADLGSLNNGDFRDQLNPALDYGNSDFDVRHHFVGSFLYELPLGKGQAFGGNASGFWNQLIGNWQMSGIVSASTGNYFTVTDPTSNIGLDCGGNVLFNCARPNQVADPNGKPCVAGTFFNTCAFVSNTLVGTLGTEGRNVVRGPGYQEWDLSLLKSFPISEHKRLEFHAEAFNVANHVNPLTGRQGQDGQLEPVSVEVGTAQEGFFQAARDPRLIQFALKFYF
ncbi:MAG: TonB-dependent receptor [Candidatus Sulfotelmatobacter sp.]